MCQVPPRFVYKKFTNLHLGQNATKYAQQNIPLVFEGDEGY